MEVLFKKTIAGDWLDKLVGWWTSSEVCHVELKFSDGICFSSTPKAGVRFKKIPKDDSVWVSFTIRIDYKTEQIIRRWCEKEVGKKYDFLGIFGFVFNRKVESPHRWYCSEICSRALEKGKVMDFEDWHLSPGAMYEVIKKEL